jgi:hypothetical protein
MAFRKALVVLAWAGAVAAVLVTAARGPTAPRVPTLRNAAALGVLIHIDAPRGLAEFRISCGWYYSPKEKVRVGLWKVDLRHLSFGDESNPANMAAGHVNTVPLKSWEHWAALRGWSGTLRLRELDGYLSNGPTTDICAGDLG